MPSARPLLLLLLACSGCATAPAPRPPADATAALIAHPDFPLVARTSPAWVRAALETITSLESELAAK
jgi:hypothetical protein